MLPSIEKRCRGVVSHWNNASCHDESFPLDIVLVDQYFPMSIHL